RERRERLMSAGGRNIAFHVTSVVAVIAALAGAITLASSRKRAEAEEVSSRAAELALGPRVEVGKVELSPPGRTVTITGEAKPFRQATIYAKVSGYLKSVHADKGDHVKANEILGVVEAPETENDVASKKADLAIKKLTNQRNKSLVENGILSQQELERS